MLRHDPAHLAALVARVRSATERHVTPRGGVQVTRIVSLHAAGPSARLRKSGANHAAIAGLERGIRRRNSRWHIACSSE
jgi:hypothetical protein